MLKTIFAALLAVSVLAAPAMAAGHGRSAHNPEFRGVHLTPNVLNAKARWGSNHRHHHKHFRHNYRFHNHR